MKNPAKKTFLTATLVLVTTLSAVYLFIAFAIIPYWQTLSGVEIQTWFQLYFGGFAGMMIPVHLLCVLSMVIGFFIFRKEEKSVRIWWAIALGFLILCEATTPMFYAHANEALSSATLAPEAALEMLDEWASLHTIRTIFALGSLLGLGVVSVKY